VPPIPVLESSPPAPPTGPDCVWIIHPSVSCHYATYMESSDTAWHGGLVMEQEGLEQYQKAKKELFEMKSRLAAGELECVVFL